MYQFRDTLRDSGGDGAILPSEAMSINGTYIEDVIDGYRTLSVTGREVTETEITTKQIGEFDGVLFKYKRLQPREIVVNYQLLSVDPKSFREKFNKLNALLNFTQAQLIFADEPDKYFVGTKSKVENPEEGVVNVTASFTIYCSDPRKLSVVEKTFTASKGSDGALHATVVNNGSLPASLSYEIIHKHDNGYIGIASTEGAMEYGKIDEVDAEEVTKSQVLFNYPEYSDIIGSFTVGQGVYDANHSEYGKNGTFTSVTLDGKNWLSLNAVGSGGVWHGAICQKILPADVNGAVGAENFFFQTRVWFETTKVNQTGCPQMVIGDTSGKHVASIHVVKSSTTSNSASVVFQVRGKEVKRIKFTPDSKNPLASGKGGYLYIRKSGGLFEFYFNGKKYSFNYPAYASVQAYSCTVSLIQCEDRGKANLIGRMAIRDVHFQKDNVTAFEDIPNRYPINSVVTIDGDTSKIYVDGKPAQSDELRGTTYFKAPPGELDVQIVTSEFSDPAPDVKIYVREAWL